MSEIITQVDRLNGQLHMVKANDQHYWVSTIEPDMPMNRSWETAAVKCRKDGKVNQSDWRNPQILIRHQNQDNACELHEEICDRLEEYLNGA